jgi:hypothetical protein
VGFLLSTRGTAVVTPCLHRIGRGRLCGRLSRQRRCPNHQLDADRAQRARRPQLHTHVEVVRRARVVADHIHQHGYVCPGCPLSSGRPHQADPDTNPLTADHYVPVAAGGPEDGPLRVMCRRGNSARGARTTPGRHTVAAS